MFHNWIHPRGLLRGSMGLVLFIGLHLSAFSQQTTGDPTKKIEEVEKKISDLQKKLTELKAGVKKPLDYADVAKWRSIRGISLSRDGLWVAYRVGPAEGDSELVVKQLKTDKEHKFSVGSGLSQMGFSHNGKWFAFTSTPPKQLNFGISISGTSSRTPPQPKVTLLNLTTGERLDMEGIRRFSFNGEASTHIAFQKFPATPSTTPTGPSSSNLPPALA